MTAKTKQEFYFIADSINKTLCEELEIYINACKKKEKHLIPWAEHFFIPALESLKNKEKTPIQRLHDACLNLQIWGGMGSWSDVGIHIPNTNLFESYTKANNLYQEAWEAGII